MTPGSLIIEDVEWHGRIEQDWYAATALVDLLSFIYVAVFYQVILRSHHLNLPNELFFVGLSPSCLCLSQGSMPWISFMMPHNQFLWG